MLLVSYLDRAGNFFIYTSMLESRNVEQNFTFSLVIIMGNLIEIFTKETEGKLKI